MYLKHFLFTIAFMFSIYISVGQTKNEKEERIKVSEFPEMAKKVIDQLPKNCKRVRFYRETDGEKQSFEVKFKFKRQHYSLEFSKSGHIEDMEVVTRFKKIKKEPKEKIESYFEQTFDKHKFIKIQKQYVYNKQSTSAQFLEEVFSKKLDHTSNFEIIAEVRTEKKREIREFTFDDKGLFLNFRILNPTSYEHVLY